jgi:hypothetical protein
VTYIGIARSNPGRLVQSQTVMNQTGSLLGRQIPWFFTMLLALLSAKDTIETEEQ